MDDKKGLDKLKGLAKLDALGKLTIGEILRATREKKELKVYELADLVKVNPVYITQIEKDYKLPSCETFIKIIKTLNPDFQTFMVLNNKFQRKKYPHYQEMQDLFIGYIKKNFPDVDEKTLGKKFKLYD